MTEKQIESNLEIIQSSMDIKVEQGDINGAMDKLSNITVLYGLSSECVRHAKSHCLTKQGSLLPELFKKGINATMLRLQLESNMAYELSLLIYAERINAALTHIVDAIRTQISLYKSEMGNSKFQS
ncbi:MAG TPA: hypothetical protein VK705_10140 [Ferruginibacter sp.]|jgi:hypothetical protein|nr:hypothetical protein [Ferruginibacter sp.]